MYLLEFKCQSCIFILFPKIWASTILKFFNIFQIKSGKNTPGRANVLLGGLKDLLNALFSHPDDPNLMCVVKLLKVWSIPLLTHCKYTKWYCLRANVRASLWELSSDLRTQHKIISDSNPDIKTLKLPGSSKH